MTTIAKEPLVAALVEEWAAIDDLLATLDDSDWSMPTLPGWDVHATVAHVLGTESMLAGIDRPPLPDDLGARAHVRNEIAGFNEAWIDAHRRDTPAELLAHLRAVVTRRRAILAEMSQDDFDAPSWTPIGQSTHGRFMQIRLFDCWMHEQDIRVAVARPGHEAGAPAEGSLDEIVRALGYIVGKRAGAPSGSAVTVTLTGPVMRTVHVLVNGKAAVVPVLDRSPTASLAMSSSLFARLAGGRVDPGAVRDQIALAGDIELAERVAANLAFTI